MSIDLDEIRAALVAAKHHTANGWDDCAAEDLANAPTWLAWCVDEIERLRADNELCDETIEDLDYVSQARKEMIEQLEAERDAALAEIERLIATIADVDHAVGPRIESLLIERNAWRACAELFACSDDEAFAVYDALKAGEQ